MTEEEVIDTERGEDVDRCYQVSSRFSFDPRDIMNFISIEETSVIVSAKGLWQTRDGWCGEATLGYLTFA